MNYLLKNAKRLNGAHNLKIKRLLYSLFDNFKVYPCEWYDAQRSHPNSLYDLIKDKIFWALNYLNY